MSACTKMSLWKYLVWCTTGQSLILCTLAMLLTRDVTATSPILFTSGASKEYCQLDRFEASCKDNEVVVVSSGRYGRMRLGKCLKKAYDSLGCSSDVVMQMDRLCSGRPSCSFDVSMLHGRDYPCPTDLTPFLESGYYCQPIIPSVVEGCASSPRAMVLTQPRGYISNHITVETGRGSPDCPWRIQVPEGQKINITLVNFARISLSDDRQNTAQVGSKPNICYQFAQIYERDMRSVTECEGGERLVHVYTSQTSSVNVAVLTKRDMDVFFMLYYEAVGCPNPVLPASLWVQRSGDKVTVKCNSTGETWEQRCIDQEWRGEVGNCTATVTSESPMFGGEGFPYSILIVVAIGVALGVFLGGILLVCASKYFKRRREGQSLRNETFTPGLYGVEHGKVMASQFDDVGGGTPRTLHYHGVHIEETTLPVTDKHCKCTTFSSYGPPPGYHPASQISSHMYESPQFDRKDSR